MGETRLFLKRVATVAVAAAALTGASTVPDAAALPVQGFTLPVFRAEVPAGGGTVQELAPAADPSRRAVDANPAEWHGTLPVFAGVEQYSHGELVYRDHIFDAYGPDNGQSATRLQAQNTLTSVAPEFYRLDPAYRYVPGEFGVPTGPLVTGTNYGQDPMEGEADLSEVRLGTDRRRNLWLLARTTTMNDAKPASSLLVLLDTRPGTAAHSVPFNSGLTTTHADVAVFLHGAYGAYVDLADPSNVHVLPAGDVATDPRGYTNAIEARLPAALLGDATHKVGVAVAAGLADSSGTALATLPVQPNVANVAFRLNEPARDWFEENQALQLHTGSMDAFFTTADLDRMAAGASQRWIPGPGYHDRIFSSSPAISKETDGSGMEGTLQHYGVYIPTGYRAGQPTPTQYWFHFRGGNAHIAADVVPGVFHDEGEAVNSLVITPDGRGQSGWYVGRSQQDVLEVWRDSHRLLSIDRNRTYIAGHSMGGWASYLLPIEHPDWFAAAFPASGPPTQGLYTGAPGCTSNNSNGGACFQQANGGDAAAEYTGPLLGNLKRVPYVIFHGTDDELVPVTGVVVQANALRTLGYRYRLYLFPGQEHYGPPVVDQWTEGAQYEHQFVRDPNPPEVVYTRSMTFEHAIEHVNDGGATLSFPLDSAYWMSGLEPTDPKAGAATVDIRSLAIPEAPHTVVPEVTPPVSPTQGSPYVMQGQAWQSDIANTPAAQNAFTATLTGASAVTLDTRRMRLTARSPITGTLTADAPLTLTLLGGFPRTAQVTIDGAAASVTRSARGLVIAVPSGAHTLGIS